MLLIQSIRESYFFNPFSLPFLIVGILCIWEGVFVFIQQRRSMINIGYMLSSVSAGIWLSGVGIIQSISKYPLAVIWAKYYDWLGIFFVPSSIYLFSVAWHLEDLSKKRGLILTTFFLSFLFYIFCISSNYIISGVWPYSWGFYPRGEWGEGIFIAWFAVLMIISLRKLILRYKEENDFIKKKQARSVAIAISIAFIGAIDFISNFGVSIYPLGFIPIFICITLVGYSIIRYKLMDIETVIHKSIGWFLTNLVLIIPFITLVYITRSWYIHFEGGGTFIFLGGVLLAFLFFVRIFYPKIDHFFQRRRFDLEEIASKFIEDVVNLKGINKLVEYIEEVIKETLYSHPVDIFIYDENKRAYRLANFKDNIQKVLELESDNQFLQWLVENDKVVYKDFVFLDPRYSSIRDKAKDYFNLTQAIVVVPLILNDKLLGIINLGKKVNLRRYNAFDIHFLRILKSQSAVAISNSLVYDNIEREVKQRTKELVEIQKQLIQAEKLATVGTLAGGVAHEINNPLTAILTNVQMLLSSDTIGNGDVKESLQLIEEATRRCRAIVQKLMAYARRPLESGKFSKINLRRVVEDALSFLGYQLEQENIKVLTHIKGDKFLIYGNKNELEQVVTNLILNAKDAIKKVKKGGNIWISLSEERGWINMEIKDEGVGIPEEIRSKIFDPFFTTKEVGKGLGLGLSICQAIVERHNGIIELHTELKKGTTFAVRLPKIRKRIRK